MKVRTMANSPHQTRRRLTGACYNILLCSITFGITLHNSNGAFIPSSSSSGSRNRPTRSHVSNDDSKYVAGAGGAFGTSLLIDKPKRNKNPAYNSCLYLGSEWYSQAGGDDNDDDEDEDESIDLGDKDWRAFRAKLVMQPEETESSSSQEQEETQTIIEDDPEDLDGIGRAFSQQIEQPPPQEESSSLPNILLDDNTQWAYDSGNVIEKGAVILGGVEQEFGFGLRQQYFHKAAILVLDHDDGKFTKGILLNRPSDKMLVDPENPSAKWRVWFGGDVQGLDSVMPDIVCLHSLESEVAGDVSTKVMRDIQWTTFENAKMLVNTGIAKPSDFWVFCGYAGWGPGQLMGELERKSWYMVATDSQTLLQELARQAQGADPRDSGLETWSLLMNMIGKSDTAKDTIGEFDDLMLKEWSREHLVSTGTDEDLGLVNVQNVDEGIKDLAAKWIQQIRDAPVGVVDDEPPKKSDAAAADDLAQGNDEEILPGTLLRASSAQRSPFLLSQQELHKSIILVLSDDDTMTTGAILNRPASKGLDLQIVDRITMEKRTVTIPLRYGGEYAIRGKQSLLWLHCNENMRRANIGSMIVSSSSSSEEAGTNTPKSIFPSSSSSSDGEKASTNTTPHSIWTCTPEQATTAIGQGIAKPHDFMLISGVSVWPKGGMGATGGIQETINKGEFALVNPTEHKQVWDILLQQELLSGVNLYKILSIGHKAWVAAGGKDDDIDSQTTEDDARMDGIGEGYDEEDDSIVFKSDVKVSSLADDALRSWIATFLLGLPTM